MQIQIPANWVPRDYQLPLWGYLENGGKRAVAVWHRRAGKDDIALRWAVVSSLQKPGNYWHMLPQAEQARKAVWTAVNPHTGKRRLDETFPPEIVKRRHDHEMFLELAGGSTWQVVGSDNYNSLMGSPPVGVVFSEWALADPNAWAYISPILEENNGWAVFIYTPRGTSHGKRMFDYASQTAGWFAERLTARETGVFTPEALIRIENEYTAQWGPDEGRALFQQEYECSFAAGVRGAYYATMLEQADKDGRIGKVPIDPRLPVNTAWDLGIGDATAIWFFQLAGFEVRFIDYYEASGVGIDHYAQVLQGKRYLYGQHILPHDAEPKQLGTGLSIRESLSKLGLQSDIAPRLTVDGGIQAVRSLLPRSYFDSERCARGIEALREYRKEWDDELRTYKHRPLHDWTSHAADAIRYAAVGMKERRTAKAPPIKYPSLGIV